MPATFTLHTFRISVIASSFAVISLAILLHQTCVGMLLIPNASNCRKPMTFTKGHTGLFASHVSTTSKSVAINPPCSSKCLGILVGGKPLFFFHVWGPLLLLAFLLSVCSSSAPVIVHGSEQTLGDLLLYLRWM